MGLHCLSVSFFMARLLSRTCSPLLMCPSRTCPPSRMCRPSGTCPPSFTCPPSRMCPQSRTCPPKRVLKYVPFIMYVPSITCEHSITYMPSITYVMSRFGNYSLQMVYIAKGHAQFECIPVSILRKSISGRHRPVRVADGPMMARCRFT